MGLEARKSVFEILTQSDSKQPAKVTLAKTMKFCLHVANLNMKTMKY